MMMAVTNGFFGGPSASHGYDSKRKAHSLSLFPLFPYIFRVTKGWRGLLRVAIEKST